MTDPPKMPATLLCSLCLHLFTNPSDAVTIINGQAVCMDHLGYVQGGTWSMALATAQRESKRS